jgi:uncharacterized protein (DUF427 family)
MKNRRPEPGPGQESVWDYPRPPRVEKSSRSIKVVFNGETIVDTTRAYRVLETSHPPVYYIHPDQIKDGVLEDSPASSWCEWKGRAQYFDVVVNGRRVERAAWTYPEPAPGFEAIRNHVAFYPGRMDACYVNGERVTPQEGDFYGGWITSTIVGPFKGGSGTIGW